MSEGAAFIGITSTLAEAEDALPNMLPYIAAKKELRTALRTLSTELSPRGIRVYAVAPGFMEGGLNAKLPRPVLELLAQKTGAGVAEAGDVAALVEKLCAGEMGYPSGISVSVPLLVQSAL
jgi:NAD(P)-dependent dehydrogenase (short-subunit alcohol dehydrogenase family)